MPDGPQPDSPPVGAGGACPACEGTGVVQFAWGDLDTRSRNPEIQRLAAYRTSLPQERKLRSGWLCRCPNCGQRWYLDRDSKFMHLLADEQWDLVARWNERPLALSEPLLKTLKAIGATPPDIYGNGRERIEIPCRVETRDGQTHDPAIVCLQKIPPLGIFRRERHLVSEITSVEPSRLALSREVRLASTRAHETRMGLSPFAVQDGNGQIFMLNGTTNFFRHPGYEAQELGVYPGEITESIQGAVHVREPEPTIFVGDWDDALLFLRIGET